MPASHLLGADAAPGLRAERLRPALQTRVLGRAGTGAGAQIRALHLTRGAAQLRGPDERTLTAPVFAWMPWDEALRLDLGASAQGVHLLVDPGALERALHHRPEAATLRFIAGRTTVLQLGADAAAGTAVQGCLDGMLSETQGAAALAPAVIDSLLHVLLVLLYRGQPQAVQAEARGTTALGTRFAALVEAHFRDHWTAQRYARVLGISRDRLNDICQRDFGRPPGALIRERLHLEARLYLENSALSIDQIGALLGFSATPQFARFFRANEGQPPGRFRAALRRGDGAEIGGHAAPYAWP
ncbi:helix-turn-helix domain-containing protein [Allosediminivita pacifica]|uniref:AraC family transcriptional regulator n=1 Tax=Allosediminivita pacifica TaxID=1267769 RepID=A0A2T6AW85_9RHOB|nr:helix-turn-helix domain-containing protein [Allosediminivita pacifica]PTX48069.1 AraC family transcriptional regulator [Allosediminivita pacifica]GGB11974.1 AraC family transcriptional regulator [Allosediminivita pacifica]